MRPQEHIEHAREYSRTQWESMKVGSLAFWEVGKKHKRLSLIFIVIVILGTKDLVHIVVEILNVQKIGITEILWKIFT